MRALANAEERMAAQRVELQSLREEATAQPDPKSSRGDLEELEALWEETHRTVTER